MCLAVRLGGILYQVPSASRRVGCDEGDALTMTETYALCPLLCWGYRPKYGRRVVSRRRISQQWLPWLRY